jgi:chaperonin GroEL
MSKTITFGSEVREALLKGTTSLKEAVATTLGPRGNIVIIGRPMGGPVATKDGVSVAREIIHKDPIEDLGAQILKEAAIKTAAEAGDGTTTATITAHAIFKEGLKAISANLDTNAIVRGINKGVGVARQVIEDMTIEVKSTQDIEHVAKVSANNDPEVGKLIATAFDSLGDDGVVTVEESRTTETFIDYVDGMELPQGYLSNAFANTPEQTTVFENPRLILSADPINDITPYRMVLELVAEKKLPLVIIADDFSPEIVKMLTVNKLRG